MAKKRGQGQYLAILTEQAWLVKDDDDDVAKGKRFLMEKSRKSQAGNLVDQKTGFFLQPGFSPVSQGEF